MYKYKRGRKWPGISHPEMELASIHSTVLLLVDAMQLLQGQTGGRYDVAVTWGDLLELGLITEEQIPRDVGADRIRR